MSCVCFCLIVDLAILHEVNVLILSVFCYVMLTQWSVLFIACVKYIYAAWFLYIMN